MKITVNCRSYEVEVQPDAVMVGSSSYKTTVLHDNGTITVRVGGRPYKVNVRDETTVLVDGRPFTVQVNGHSNGNGNGHGNGNGNGRSNGHAWAPRAAKPVASCPEEGGVRAPMPGTVLAVRVHEGEHVAAGTVLLILEAMKMQNEIKAPAGGTVKQIIVAPGQTVASGDVMVSIE